MYLFSGKIKCMKCGKNYKAKRDRGKINYICGGYASYGASFCSRNQIEEERISQIVNNHINEGDDVRDSVQRIEVDIPNITICYTDGSKSIIKPNSIIF